MSEATVFRTDSHHQLRGRELEHYVQQMIAMFGNAHLPAVVYKKEAIPARVLSDYSYLTAPAQERESQLIRK